MTTIASSSADGTAEFGCFGPVGRSATELRFRHLATVFGLMPFEQSNMLAEAFTRLWKCKGLSSELLLTGVSMSKCFVPYVGYSYAQDLQSAYRSFLTEIGPELFVTLNFNRPLVINSAQNQFKEWIGRTDRKILGCNWYKRPSHERTLALGVIENPTRNLHIHVALKFPPNAARLSRSRLLTILATSWEKLEPAGQFNSQPIYDVDKLGYYFFKQLTLRGHLERCIVLSSDFHHHVKSA